ncbi:MAG: response regulator transcription factor [Candidatus Schekmanbacteria bacterium]|nr:response regulator transcription factor [Candidatus Schekmanbacteria bacterium]
MFSQTNNHILIISEKPRLINALVQDLETLGYTILSKVQSELDMENVFRWQPKIILFDLTDSNSEEIKVCQWLKNNSQLENLGTKLILLASEESLKRFPSGLEFDDLALMPYKPKEISFRIDRLLERGEQFSEKEVLKIDDLIIYLARYEVRRQGKTVELTLKEYELLKYLLTHRGRAFTRESILNIIWGYDYYGGLRTVDVHIRRIRAKIRDEDEAYIKTVRGVGYMFRD